MVAKLRDVITFSEEQFAKGKFLDALRGYEISLLMSQSLAYTAPGLSITLWLNLSPSHHLSYHRLSLTLWLMIARCHFRLGSMGLAQV
ncbi:hypothetical protein KIPB_008451 [Kipferlia bialata]|uniref:Uncharacterized protein n=1 Tax=Kipferlia bialata TaxID=797122 RepID=A0A9K3D2E5_9EUKA|nr:hypothetical protein KIPB_008451 [Kipferlia bialata]|eukprot:g8451.t1